MCRGETSFPKLDGKCSVDRKTLIVEGVVDRGLFGNGLSWFKLALDDSGMKLQGISQTRFGQSIEYSEWRTLLQ